MMHKVLFFIKTHLNDIIAAGVGAGSLTVLLSTINLVLQILVTAATLLFFGIKIKNELRIEDKKKSELKDKGDV